MQFVPSLRCQSYVLCLMTHTFPATAVWLDTQVAHVLQFAAPDQMTRTTLPQALPDLLAALSGSQEVLLLGPGAAKYSLAQALAEDTSLAETKVHVQSEVRYSAEAFQQVARTFFQLQG